MQTDGAGFAGFAVGLDMTPAHPDMLAIPDAACAIQLPWKPEVAWVPSTLVMEGEEVAQAPRVQHFSTCCVHENPPLGSELVAEEKAARRTAGAPRRDHGRTT